MASKKQEASKKQNFLVGDFIKVKFDDMDDPEIPFVGEITEINNDGTIQMKTSNGIMTIDPSIANVKKQVSKKNLTKHQKKYVEDAIKNGDVLSVTKAGNFVMVETTPPENLSDLIIIKKSHHKLVARECIYNENGECSINHFKCDHTKKNEHKCHYFAKEKPAEPEVKVQTKFCPHCQTDKPVSEFWKMKSSKDGYQGWCKSCQLNP